MSKFQPMLAERNSVHNWPESLILPVYGSIKYDGIRCLVKDGTPLSRKLLPIPNPHIQCILSDTSLNGLDGEIIVGEANAENVFNKTQSVVMSKREEVVDFKFYVFDIFDADEMPYMERLAQLLLRHSQLPEYLRNVVEFVRSDFYTRWEDIEGAERAYVAAGYEGMILRHPGMPYKFGRSTKREQGMLKLKRFVDAEAEIIGFQELEHNNNEAGVDELGNTKRSKQKDGMVAGDTLGALICRDLESGVEFGIGTFKGLTMADRKAIWNARDRYFGRIVKYSYFPVGVKEAPRSPKFIGFRDKADL